MNKLLLLVTLLALTKIAAAVTCNTNASVNPTDNTKCLCNAGYWGSDGVTAACTQCTGNTSSTPGASNTGGTVNVSACNICVAGYYVSNAATSSAAATCTPCTGNATPATQSTSAGASVGVCNACMMGYYYAAAPASATVTPTCTQCPSYSTTSAIQTAAGFCTCYDSGANPLSATVTSCACKSGKGSPVQTAGGTSTCTTNAVILSAFAALLSFVFII